VKPSGAKDSSASEAKPAEPKPEAAPKTDDALLAKLKAVEEERDRLKAEAADFKDKFLRARADYENLSRRTQKESVDTVRTAKGLLLLRFAGLLETMERAYADLEREAPERAKGLKLVLDEGRKILKDEGIKTIETDGQMFNYRLHQAVESVETPERPEGTILGTVQRGYLLGTDVLRPALVRVAVPPRKPPAKAESAQPG
jgi:molecular chaperone GrpE